MATPRLTMSNTKEILCQKWLVGRSHREVAHSLSVSAGVVGSPNAQRTRARSHLPASSKQSEPPWVAGRRPVEVPGLPGPLEARRSVRYDRISLYARTGDHQGRHH